MRRREYFYRALVCPMLLILPLLAAANSDFTLLSPQNGSTVVVTPNQSLPVLMTINDTDTGLSALFGRQYITTATVSLTCPAEANPCSTYASSPGPVPPFILTASTQFHSAILVVNFRNAPPGFYAVNAAISVQGCYVNAPNCTLPDAYSVILKFTVQVVSSVGAAPNSLPEFAIGSNRFVTDFLVVNNGSQPAQFTISFYDDTGAPATLVFNGLGSLTSLSDTVPAYGTNLYEAGNISGPLQGGWGSIQADPSLTIQELIRSRSANGTYYEATVPAYAGGTGFRLAFDATTFQPTGDQVYTGFAVANLDSMNPATVTCTAYDFRGQTIPNAITIPTLNPLGHWADYLFPALQGVRGLLDCSSTTAVAAIGLRFVGSDALSSLPIVLK